jgi:hypothetical protein
MTTFWTKAQTQDTNIQIVPGDIKIGKERLNVLAYDIVLLGKNEIEIRQLFIEMESAARKLGLQINRQKLKYMTVGRKNTLRQKTEHLKKKKDYKFKRVESFKYLGAINSHKRRNK